LLAQEYQAIVDAEWEIIFQKLDALVKTHAKVVLSKLPIGDLATQYAFPLRLRSKSRALMTTPQILR